MDWSKIIDFLRGDAQLDLIEFFYNLINGIFIHFITETAKEFFKSVTDVLNTYLFAYTTVAALKKYVFDYTAILLFMQTIAGTLLVLMVTLEAMERHTSGFISDKTRSLSMVMGRTIKGGIAIFFIPTVFFDILMKINGAFIVGFQSLLSIDLSKELEIFLIIDFAEGTGISTTILSSVTLVTVVVAFAVLAFHAAVRYIELIVCVIVSPLICATLVRTDEYFMTWLKETIAIVFTQSFHVLLFLMAMKYITQSGLGLVELATLGRDVAFTKFMSFLAIIVIAIKGPKAIKQFLYSSGVGGGLMGVASSSARIVTTRFALRR